MPKVIEDREDRYALSALKNESSAKILLSDMLHEKIVLNQQYRGIILKPS
jgi:hypothetical protein